ncbi:MAG: PH domain-containing protein [Phycisphaerales bacterium]|nr:PH domain-containing protein [Phycisphaerales bacterium]
MASLDKALLPGEEVLYRARLSSLPLYIDGGVLLAGLVMIVAGLMLLGLPVAGFSLIGLGGVVLLFGCGRLARTMVQRGTTDMLVTNRRVLSRVGVLRKESEEMFLGKIESVEIRQTLLARAMNYGSIEVNGSGEGELVFTNIAAPKEFRDACMNAVDLQGSNRGAAPATPAAGESAAVYFEVEVLDEAGSTARWIEVRAQSAESARSLAAAAGVKAGQARLKRIG